MASNYCRYEFCTRSCIHFRSRQQSFNLLVEQVQTVRPFFFTIAAVWVATVICGCGKSQQTISSPPVNSTTAAGRASRSAQTVAAPSWVHTGTQGGLKWRFYHRENVSTSCKIHAWCLVPILKRQVWYDPASFTKAECATTEWEYRMVAHFYI